jgi:predicted transcriptional regulator
MQLLSNGSKHQHRLPILKKRRDATRLIYDMLTLVRGGSAKTHVVYKANLNFRLAKRYFEFLTSNGYVTLQNPLKSARGPYRLTDKGEKLLALLRQVEKELHNMFSDDPEQLGPCAPSSVPPQMRRRGRIDA